MSCLSAGKAAVTMPGGDSRGWRELTGKKEQVTDKLLKKLWQLLNLHVAGKQQ